MRKQFLACCAHEGETGNDESVQDLTQKTSKFHHPASTEGPTHASCFQWITVQLRPLICCIIFRIAQMIDCMLLSIVLECFELHVLLMSVSFARLWNSRSGQFKLYCRICALDNSSCTANSLSGQFKLYCSLCCDWEGLLGCYGPRNQSF